ncbi:MAG: hypothetical protein NTW90_06800 [Nitrosospira sp.]|nr:hypothetical protein [Nitrosospira sp.]
MTLKSGFILFNLLMFLYIILELSKRSEDSKCSFNWVDLLLIRGKASKSAIVFLGSWLVLTVSMLYMTIMDRLTVELFTAYGAITVAPAITRQFSPNKEDFSSTTPGKVDE